MSNTAAITDHTIRSPRCSLLGSNINPPAGQRVQALTGRRARARAGRGQGQGRGPGRLGSEQAAERVAVERIAVLEIGVHHGVAAVPAEAFEPGGMHAEIHAGGERAALEAVAAERCGVEAGGGGAGLHDAGDGARIDRLGADGGRAGDAAARGREPDAAEQ